MVVGVGALLWFLFGSSPEIVNYPPKDDTIAAFGDSLVSGVGSTKENDFVSLLSQKLETPILNLGVSGNTTSQGLARIQKVIAEDPGTVILLLGGNDYLQKIPREQTFGNLRTIITELQKQGAMVVLLGVRGGVLRDSYENEFELLAEETGSLYVSDVLGGLIGNMTYMSDAIHPNDKGYAYIAERVFEVLKDYRK